MQMEEETIHGKEGEEEESEERRKKFLRTGKKNDQKNKTTKNPTTEGRGLGEHVPRWEWCGGNKEGDLVRSGA